MKVKFNHKLNIGESRVMEVLSAMIALSQHGAFKPVIDLEGFSDLAMKFEPEITWMKTHESFLFSWMEFALCIPERTHIIAYFDAISSLPLTKRLVYFLGSNTDEASLDSVIHVPQALTDHLTSVGIENAKELTEICMHFEPFTERFKQFALAIDTSREFDEKWRFLIDSNAFEATKSTFKVGMAERHPLSYAQELMGKPFWNIADYKNYEFLTLYYLSPIRLRLMDGDKMIYVHSLIRSNQEALETPEGISEALKLLGDANRMRILQMLYMKPMYGKEIADATGLTTATVSHHLDVLKQQGLLNMEQSKQIKYFSTNLYKLRELFNAAEAFLKSKDKP